MIIVFVRALVSGHCGGGRVVSRGCGGGRRIGGGR